MKKLLYIIRPKVKIGYIGALKERVHGNLRRIGNLST